MFILSAIYVNIFICVCIYIFLLLGSGGHHVGLPLGVPAFLVVTSLFIAFLWLQFWQERLFDSFLNYIFSRCSYWSLLFLQVDLTVFYHVNEMHLFLIIFPWCAVVRRLEIRRWQDQVMLRWQYEAKNDLRRTTEKWWTPVICRRLKFVQKLLARSRQVEASWRTSVRGRHHGTALRQEGCLVTVLWWRITVFTAQSVTQNGTVLCDDRASEKFRKRYFSY